jgi:hypothetical protein
MARGLRCKAHKHSSVVAEENHHLQPQSRGGLTVVANMRYLCANAHGDTHYLLDLIEKFATPMIGTDVTPGEPYRQIPWSTLRTYGPGIRNAAMTGWYRYGAAFLAGDYRRHAALWLTSGQPRPNAWIAAGLAVDTPVPSYAQAFAEGRVDDLRAAVRL